MSMSLRVWAMGSLTTPAFNGGMTINLFRTAAMVGAMLTVGLMAGLYAAFSYAVMPGLARCDDRTFTTAMRAINGAILNGWFALCFVGALVFLALATVLHLIGPDRRALPWVSVALALYLVTLVVTIVVNVPLNDALAAAGGDQAGDVAAARARFEATWVAWNVVRALASTAAFGCLTWAALLTGRDAWS